MAPTGRGCQQPVEVVVAKALRLRQPHLVILDAEDVAVQIIAILQFQQRFRRSGRPGGDLLQPPALCRPGVVSILALRLVCTQYLLGQAPGCVIFGAAQIGVVALGVGWQHALVVA